MNLTCNRASLLHALTFAAAVAMRTHPKPATRGVLLVAERWALRVRAGNVELSIDQSIAAEVDEPGEVLVPAERLRDVVKACADDTLTLEADVEKLVVLAPEAEERFEMGLMAMGHFQTASVDGDVVIALSCGELARLIRQTAFAAGDVNDERFAMTGMRLEAAANGAVRAMATDGCRASVSGGMTYGGGPAEVLVPAAAMKLAKCLLKDELDAAYIRKSDKHAELRVGEARLTMRLVEGTLPDPRRLLRGPTQLRTAVTARELREAAIRACRKEARWLRMTLRPGGLVVFGNDRRRATVIPCAYDGPSVEGSYGATCFKQAIRACADDPLSLEFHPHCAVLLGERFIHLIAPRRSRGEEVRELLADPKTRTLPNREIARRVGFNPGSIAKYRNELRDSAQMRTTAQMRRVVVRKDVTYQMDTSRIGKRGR